METCARAASGSTSVPSARRPGTQLGPHSRASQCLSSPVDRTHLLCAATLCLWQHLPGLGPDLASCLLRSRAVLSPPSLSVLICKMGVMTTPSGLLGRTEQEKGNMQSTSQRPSACTPRQPWPPPWIRADCEVSSEKHCFGFTNTNVCPHQPCHRLTVHLLYR